MEVSYGNSAYFPGVHARVLGRAGLFPRRGDHSLLQKRAEAPSSKNEHLSPPRVLQAELFRKGGEDLFLQ